MEKEKPPNCVTTFHILRHGSLDAPKTIYERLATNKAPELLNEIKRKRRVAANSPRTTARNSCILQISRRAVSPTRLVDGNSLLITVGSSVAGRR